MLGEHDIFVLHPSPDVGALIVERTEFGEVWRMPVGPPLGRIRRSARAIERSLLEIRPDIVHVQGAARLLPKGFPSVVTIHGLLEDEIPVQGEGIRGRVRAWAVARPERRARSVARNICSISPHVRRSIPSNSSQRIWDIPNAVQPGLFDLPIDRAAAQLLHLGYLSPRKDIRTLLRAFGEIQRTVPEARLLLGGGPTTGPYFDSCAQLVEELGIRHCVSFLGELDRESVERLLATSRVLLLASLVETAPMVISEALSTGLPVVATAVGGVPDMIHDGTAGYVVPPMQPAKMSAAVTRLLIDSDYDEFQAAARKSALKYQPGLVALKTIAMYQEVIDAW